MKIYILIDAEKGSYDSPIVGVYANRDDAERVRREIGQKYADSECVDHNVLVHGTFYTSSLAYRLDDLTIEEHEVLS